MVTGSQYDIISFDYRDFIPDNRTAGVPFAQMLPTTNLTDVMKEFQTVRANQIMKQQQAPAPAPAKPMSDTGALVAAIEQGPTSLLQIAGIPKRASSEAQRFRILYTLTARMPVHQRMRTSLRRMVPS